MDSFCIDLKNGNYSVHVVQKKMYCKCTEGEHYSYLWSGSTGLHHLAMVWSRWLCHLAVCGSEVLCRVMPCKPSASGFAVASVMLQHDKRRCITLRTDFHGAGQLMKILENSSRRFGAMAVTQLTSGDARQHNHSGSCPSVIACFSLSRLGL